jgi:hypothetical protein
MPDTITVFVNGEALAVAPGTVVSCILLVANTPCRISVRGQPRAAFCGMGICFECRAVVDGVPHTRTCQLLCKPGMRVETQQW